MKTIKGKIKLYTTSILWKGKINKEPVSLICKLGQTDIYMDLTAFRPDPSIYLKTNKLYDAKITIDNIFLDTLGEILVLKKLELSNGKIFVNIRI